MPSFERARPSCTPLLLAGPGTPTILAREGILWHLLKMHTLRLTFALAAGLALSGCFQSTTLMKINADGSGTLEETLLVTKAGLAQMRQFASLGGGQGAKAMSDPFSEEQARGVMAALGPGVTFVGSRPIESPDGEGRVITYGFKDVRLLGATNIPGADSAVDSQDSTTDNDRTLLNGNALVIRVPREGWLGTDWPKRRGGGGILWARCPNSFRSALAYQAMRSWREARARRRPNSRFVKSNSPFVRPA